MSAVRQKKLAHALVDNSQALKPLNKRDLVVSVGYSELSGEKKATAIINSKGVKDELAILGFDEQTAKEVVGQILTDDTNKPKDRLKAADMVFDVFGSKAPSKQIVGTVNLEPREEIKQYADRLLEGQRQ